VYYVISNKLKSHNRQYYTILHNTTQYFIMDRILCMEEYYAILHNTTQYYILDRIDCEPKINILHNTTKYYTILHISHTTNRN
jgi:hypothetical protein